MEPGAELAESLFDTVTAHGPLPYDRQHRLALDLARELTSLHAGRRFHGAATPAEVALTATGAQLLPATDTTIARAGYLCPEAARGHEVGPPADIYALGAIVAFAATGRHPFGTGTPTELLHRVLDEAPDLAGIPDALGELVAECLRKDPDTRPLAAQLVGRLTPAQPVPAGQAPPPVAELPEPAPGPAVSPTGRTPHGRGDGSAPTVPGRRTGTPKSRISLTTALVVGALSSVLVVLMAVGFVALRDNSDSSATAGTATPSNPAVPSRISLPGINDLAVSRDGRRVYAARKADNSVSVVDTGTNTISTVISVPGAPEGLTLSPNGDFLYVSTREVVAVVETRSNTVLHQAVNDLDTWATRIAVTTDGRKLYVGNYRPGGVPSVSVLDATTLAVLTTIPFPEQVPLTRGTGANSVDSIAVAPDGRTIHFGRTRDVAALDTTTGTVTSLLAQDNVVEGLAVSADSKFICATAGFSMQQPVTVADTTHRPVGQYAVPTRDMMSDVVSSPDGRYFFVAGHAEYGGGVLVIDPARSTVVDTLPSDQALEQVAITPDGKHLYAATEYSLVRIELSEFA